MTALLGKGHARWESARVERFSVTALLGKGHEKQVCVMRVTSQRKTCWSEVCYAHSNRISSTWQSIKTSQEQDAMSKRFRSSLVLMVKTAQTAQTHDVIVPVVFLFVGFSSFSLVTSSFIHYLIKALLATMSALSLSLYACQLSDRGIWHSKFNFVFYHCCVIIIAHLGSLSILFRHLSIGV